ncbi:rRNA-processing protein and EBNA1-binding protein ebp2 [Apophysomyces sp. BC1034]|nr:rRNA-processing protein and EBNA1-binding protein ebp2 [Apophysomyces sp. BC1015]KAG0173835.1 rRNA-processing protein and EBNA1-binding protein ebp2 [Apophysomyces sp. BC1021]KAG0185629.1 rRNA-processing protein and EBNA1-binding protein ebp2 [Apophysomyces sp. BC1034]
MAAKKSRKPTTKVQKEEKAPVVEVPVEESESEVEDVEEVVEEEDEEDMEEIPEPIPLEDLDESDIDDEDGDLVTEQRITVNNEAALTRLTEDLKLKDLPWIETLTVTSSKPVEVEDVHDDMARELAFYQQALEAVHIAREKIQEAGVPFSRPDDYYAEMLKSDEHMAKVRQRLLDQAGKVKASDDAKRQRELKKFGKKVQVEKQLERQKQKSDMLDKIKLLKRKRKDGSGGDFTLDDDFDIELENADSRTKRAKPELQKNKKRIMKDTKYGHGGKKRHSKSNTSESSSALGGYNKMKGRPLYLGKGKAKGAAGQRPGKAKRQAMRNKK